MDTPIQGKWYWIRMEDQDGWFIGVYDQSSAGNWSNWDTWEDWEGDVVEWIRIPEPDELRKVS